MTYMNRHCKKSLLLTATPSETMMEYLDCDVIYDYPMSEAIRNGYVCDYLVNFPIVNLQTNQVNIDVPTELQELDYDLTIKCLFLISGMLETGSRKCIVYCGCIEECDAFNVIFKKIVEEYHYLECWTSSITANTSMGRREKILKEFQENEMKLSILCSVRILNEGINIVKCDSVFITKVNKNEITAVQRMCRAIRINRDNLNKVAQCFIWADDLDKTVEMLQFLKTNDETGFFNKIVTRNGNYDRKSNSAEVQMEMDYTKTVREYISVKCMNYEDRWKMRLQEVSAYIDENGKRPAESNKDTEIKRLGQWISRQQHNYSKTEQIMKNEEIRELWEQFIKKYETYFISNEEQWKNVLKEVSEYIDEYKMKPSPHNKDTEIKRLGSWISNQQTNYSKTKDIMKNEEIRELWEQFIKKYQEYFISNEEQWKMCLQEVMNYIDENEKIPSTIDKDSKIKKMRQWIKNQQRNYTNKKYIMENEEIRELWKQFVKKYKKYLIFNEEKWKMRLQEVMNYIDENEKIPSTTDKDVEIKRYGQWISHQQEIYPTKKHIMVNEDIRKLWEGFVKKYQEYFISNEERWKNTLKEVVIYIDKNNKRPYQRDKDVKIKKLGIWIGTQQKNYASKKKIMKNAEILELWEEFVKKYQEYFKK